MAKDKTKDTTRYIEQLLGREPTFSSPDPDPDPDVPSPSVSRDPKEAFLKAYTTNGGITRGALKTAGVSRDTLLRWQTDDPDFKKDFEEIQNHWVEDLRRTAFLRAQAKSDVLLMFLLKALQPQVFDDDVRKQQYVGLLNSSKDAIPVRATLVRDNTFNFNVSEEKAQEIREILLEDSESSED